MHAQAGAMRGTPPGDHGSDPGLPDLLAVFVVVIAAVGINLIRPLAWPATAAPHRRMAWIKGMS
jgi:hypothetical protein